MVDCVGPLAALGCEPRQAWKGATVAADARAGMRLAQSTALTLEIPHELSSPGPQVATALLF